MDPQAQVVACGRDAAALLGRLLGDDLVAVYLGGSGALCGVAAGRSDVDLVAVCAAAPGDELRRAVVDGLRELAMGWPLRGWSSSSTPGPRSPPRASGRASSSTSTSALGCRTTCRWTRSTRPTSTATRRGPGPAAGERAVALAAALDGLEIPGTTPLRLCSVCEQDGVLFLRYHPGPGR